MCRSVRGRIFPIWPVTAASKTNPMQKMTFWIGSGSRSPRSTNPMNWKIRGSGWVNCPAQATCSRMLNRRVSLGTMIRNRKRCLGTCPRGQSRISLLVKKPLHWTGSGRSTSLGKPPRRRKRSSLREQEKPPTGCGHWMTSTTIFNRRANLPTTKKSLTG